MPPRRPPRGRSRAASLPGHAVPEAVSRHLRPLRRGLFGPRDQFSIVCRPAFAAVCSLYHFAECRRDQVG
eukprot:305301-Lingulodinium_polyedra.AAC.1